MRLCSSLVLLGLCACPSKPPGPAPARLELSPAAFLLTPAAASKTLTLKGFDAQGAEVGVEGATWTSSRPDVVSVDANGVAKALKTPGSATLTATVNGLAIRATVATVEPVSNALLVTDAQLGRALEPVDPVAKFGPGFQLKVSLVGVSPPAVGAVLIASETAPLAGKVVAVDGQKVTLEIVPLAQVFKAIDFREKFSNLPEEIPVRTREAFSTQANADGTTTFTLKKAQPLKTEFEVGPFDCKAQTALAFGFDKAELTLDSNPSWEVELTRGAAGSSRSRLVLTDAPTVTLRLKPTLRGDLNGTLECKLKLYTREIPIPGPVGIFLGVIIEGGVGFALAGTTPIVSGVALDFTARAKGNVKVGFDCTGAACTTIHEVDVTKADAMAGPPAIDFTLPQTAPRLELGADVFGYIEVKAGVTILRRFSFSTPRELEAGILEGRLGLHAGASLATESRQVADKGYGSSYQLDFHGEVKAGDEIAMLISLLELGLGPLELKFDLNIGASPKASFSLNKGDYAVGDSVEARLKFNPATISLPLFGDNLEEVRLMRKVPRADGTFGLVLVAKQAAASKQVDFTLTGVATEAGPADSYVAFAVSKLLPAFSLEQEQGCAPPAGFVYCVQPLGLFGYGPERITGDGGLQLRDPAGALHELRGGNDTVVPQFMGLQAKLRNDQGQTVYVSGTVSFLVEPDGGSARIPNFEALALNARGEVLGRVDVPESAPGKRDDYNTEALYSGGAARIVDPHFLVSGTNYGQHNMRALSDTGVMAGYTQFPGNLQTPATWPGRIALPYPADAKFASAAAISGDGRVVTGTVVVSTSPSVVTFTARWENGAITNLGFNDLVVHGLNKTGDILANRTPADGGPGGPVVIRKTGELKLLELAFPPSALRSPTCNALGDDLSVLCTVLPVDGGFGREAVLLVPAP